MPTHHHQRGGNYQARQSGSLPSQGRQFNIDWRQRQSIAPRSRSPAPARRNDDACPRDSRQPTPSTPGRRSPQRPSPTLPSNVRSTETHWRPVEGHASFPKRTIHEDWALSWRQTEAATRPHEEDVVAGIILEFPRGFKTGTQSESILLRDQPWVNSRAPGHPVLVWSTYWKGDVQIARCLQMTSFKEQFIEEKYRWGLYAWRTQVQYIPISQGGKITASATNQPSLQLEDDESMSKQTYAHLDHFFEIEVKHLRKRPAKGSNCSRHLTSDALDVLVYKLERFVQGDLWRRRHEPSQWAPSGDAKPPVVSPLCYTDCAQQRFHFSAEDRKRSQHGREMEKERLAKAGKYEWTGFETSGPLACGF